MDAAVLGVRVEASGAEQATRALHGVETAAKGTHTEFLKMGAVMGATSAVVTAGLTAIGSAATAALGALAQSTVGMNSSLEQASIAFTTMLGSAEKAQAFLKDMQQFAATTPFQFPELVDAAKKMLAMGFAAEQVKPMLTSVGNAVAAVGGGAPMIDRVTVALGQMQAKGKVQSEEMMQLTEHGIAAWDMLAKKLGTDVAGAMALVEKRQVDAAAFFEAFQTGVASRYGDMMAAQSHTFAGAMSTIKDVLAQTVGGGFQPFFAAISGLADQFAQFVQTETLSIWAQDLQIKLGQLVPAFTAMAEWLMGQIPAAMSAAEAAAGGFVQVVQGIVTHWDAAMAGLTAGVETATAPIRAMIGIWQAAFQTVGIGGDQVKDALGMIGAAALTFGQLWQEAWQTVQIVAVEAMNAVIPLFEQVRDWLGDQLGPALAGLQAAWEGFWSQAGPAVEAMWAVVGPILGAFKDFFLDALGEQLRQTLQAAGDSFNLLGETIGNFFSWLGGLLKPIADKLAPEMQAFVAGLTTAWQGMAPPAKAAAEETVAVVRQAFVQGMVPAAEAVAEVAGRTAEAVQGVGAAAAVAADATRPLVAVTAEAAAATALATDATQQATAAAIAHAAAAGAEADALDEVAAAAQRAAAAAYRAATAGFQGTAAGVSGGSIAVGTPGGFVPTGGGMGGAGGGGGLGRAFRVGAGAGASGAFGSSSPTGTPAELEDQLTNALIRLSWARRDLAALEKQHLGNSAEAIQLAESIAIAEQSVAALKAALAQTGQTAQQVGQQGRTAMGTLADSARLAIPALGGIKMAYDGVGAAVQTLAQLEAARAQASLAWGKMLTAGTWNVGGFNVPATNLGTNATTSGQRSIPLTGGNVYGGQNNVYGIPMFDRGGVMPYDGLAHLRQGETVTPAGRGAGEVHIHVHMTDGPLAVKSVSQVRMEADDTVRHLLRAMKRVGVMG